MYVCVYLLVYVFSLDLFPSSARVLWAYRYEWAVQAVILLVYLGIALGAQAPGCPRYTYIHDTYIHTFIHSYQH